MASSSSSCSSTRASSSVASTLPRSSASAANASSAGISMMLVSKSPRFCFRARGTGGPRGVMSVCEGRRRSSASPVRRGGTSESVNGRAARVIPRGRFRTNPLRLACYAVAFAPARRSVDPWIVGKQREHRERAAFTAEDLAPQELRRGGEDIGASSGDDDPGSLLELVLELPGRPARVAGEDTHPAELAEGARVLDLAGEEADAVDDRDLGLLDVGEVREHDYRFRLHR